MITLLLAAAPSGSRSSALRNSEASPWQLPQLSFCLVIRRILCGAAVFQLGWASKPGIKPKPKFLKPGDVITMGIDGLGEHRNKVYSWNGKTK